MILARLVFITVLGIAAFAANGEVRVAFFSGQGPQGEPAQLEPGGRLYHVAVSYKNGWLVADPYYNVTFLKSLKGLGTPEEVLVHGSYPELQPSDVAPYMDQTFQLFSPWNDSKTTYCSKLVAQLLNIPPEPMDFEGASWHHVDETLPTGELGLSPDDLYEALRRQGFHPSTSTPSSCGIALTGSHRIKASVKHSRAQETFE